MDTYLLRLSVRHRLELPATWFYRPMNTTDVFRVFASADSLDSCGELTGQETFRLERAKHLLGTDGGLFRWRNKDKDIATLVHLSLVGDISPRYRNEKKSAVVKGIVNPLLTGSIGKLSFYSGVDVWTEYASDSMFNKSTYQPYDGIPYNLFGRDTKKGKARASDMLRGGIRYQWKHIGIQTAVDYLRQGPAVYYPLTFSGSAPPLTWFQAWLDLWKADYFHTFGLCKSQKDKPKYFYTHRLQVPLWKNRLVAAISETVINGSTTGEEGDSLRLNYYGEERTFEWVYMIPFIPYAFAEHYNGDRDNATVTIDFSLHYPEDFRWYAEFFIDDISAPWTLFSDDFGNKWALTAGAQWFGNIFAKDINATVEYSRVEPWVYTHFYGGSHRYSHFGQSLGSPLGPNSAALAAEVETEVTKKNAIAVRFRNTRKNSTVRGGSIKHVFQDSSYTWNDSTVYPPEPDSETKKFLGPGTVYSNRPGILWTFAPFGTFRIRALLEYDFSDDCQGVYGQVSGGFVF
ncbi:MAG: hypothetical protein GF350_03110 [Chitinivibrionales bacterium]|nr:hypothetical protein [Chitinivibrionales bacterium]